MNWNPKLGLAAAILVVIFPCLALSKSWNSEESKVAHFVKCSEKELLRLARKQTLLVWEGNVDVKEENEVKKLAAEVMTKQNNIFQQGQK